MLVLIACSPVRADTKAAIRAAANATGGGIFDCGVRPARGVHMVCVDTANTYLPLDDLKRAARTGFETWRVIQDWEETGDLRFQFLVSPDDKELLGIGVGADGANVIYNASKVERALREARR